MEKQGEQQKQVNGVHKNEEIRRQVFVIAETILCIAKSVEEALVNITSVKQVLNRITDKLNQDKFICDEEKALLELAEHWLRDERVKSGSASKNQGIKTLNLAQISALGNSFLSASTDNATCSSCLETPSITKDFPTGSTQTLNVGEELVWDGNGVELTESLHSTYLTAFKDPYALTDSTETTDNMIPKSNSYDGIYEEEMEITLEVEEGFYSDGSSTDMCFGDSIPHEDFSPQADSGVAHLDSANTTDRSMSHPDEDLAVQTPLNYNRDINTWDTYTFTLEEDILSVGSSGNSNTSTPRFTRKTKQNSLSRSPAKSPTTHLVKSALLPPVSAHDTRTRASSCGESRLLAHKPNSARRGMSNSSPKLSDCGSMASKLDDCKALDILCNTGKQMSSVSAPQANSKVDSQAKSLTKSLNDSYDVSFTTLPSFLSKNNYYHKTRSPVFV